MTAQITIRPASEADREFVAQLASTLLEFPSPAWTDPTALTRRYGETLARAVSEQDLRSTVLIAQDAHSTPVGFISLRVDRDAAGFPRGHVADLAVVETARRMGVGTALMQAGETWVRERGLSMLGLDVWSTNGRALTFYQRLGYRSESLTLIKPLD
jgi:ribosomal protein S18 acetylase RimI-like enzyme